jgi:aspartyl-tRNA(Asn)/glutamyl-tRNA(Gln) amidotransferase subunit B
LKQNSREEDIRPVVLRVIKEHPDVVATYKAGKSSAFGFFVGHVMKGCGGRANPAVVNAILQEELNKI